MLTISHVADSYRRYPGDTITYFTRVELHQPLTQLTVRIALPEPIVPNDYRAVASDGSPFPDLEVSQEGCFLAWHKADELTAGSVVEYETTVRIAPTRQDLSLVCQATASGRGDNQGRDDDEPPHSQETAVVQVFGKGGYLEHLPALYDSDDFMGRYLMLFESFWKPIETQIDHIHYYFDCRLTPLKVLPMLASWVSLRLDNRWTEAQKRQLVCAIIKIYRKRGTRWGLSKFLEIYTGVVPDITEHIGRNFVIGPQARLGYSLAMGHGNQPHTFTVKMQLPPIVAEDEETRERLESERLAMIEEIIEFEKPAHTAYRLVVSR